MPRFNKIYAGPTHETMPQVHEAPAAASTLPGSAVVLNGSGQFALAAANSTGEVFIAQDNYLAMKGVDDAIAATNTVIGLVPLDGQLFNLRFTTGQNVAKGAAIALGAGGKFVVAAAGSRVVAFAEESYNNTSGADQLIRCRAAKGYNIAAA